jgi:N-acetylglucosamine kinase-like BadF-type ATPase
VTPAAALAVDAGQTEIRAALLGERGPRNATAPGVMRMDGRVGPEEVTAALLVAIERLEPLPRPLPPAGIGLSGFEAASEEDLRLVLERLRRDLPIERASIASDGLTALLGAIGARNGSVVAAGTGTVCVGRRGDRFVKVDGWGSLLGDAGSGFSIGRAGLESALRHTDGREGSRALARAAMRRYGSISRLPETVYGAAVPTRAVAAFAIDVAGAAARGDEAAIEILAEAGRELAITACAALGRLFEPGELALVSYTGNVFLAGEPLLRPFIDEVAARWPAAEVVAPAGDSLAGAALLAEVGPRLRPEPGILWREADGQAG